MRVGRAGAPVPASGSGAQCVARVAATEPADRVVPETAPGASFASSRRSTAPRTLPGPSRSPRHLVECHTIPCRHLNRSCGPVQSVPRCPDSSRAVSPTSIRDESKTDRRDAFVLADTGHARHRQLHSLDAGDNELLEQLRVLNGYNIDLAGGGTRHSNRLRGALTEPLYYWSVPARGYAPRPGTNWRNAERDVTRFATTCANRCDAHRSGASPGAPLPQLRGRDATALRSTPSRLERQDLKPTDRTARGSVHR